MKTLLSLLDKVTKNETISMYIVVSVTIIIFSVVAPIVLDTIIDLIQ